jgi:hypothetical protein
MRGMVRSVVIYLILVGLPVLGTSVVLEKGRDLKAPMSVGGEWNLQVWPDSSCPAIPVDTLSLAVQQSGPRLEIELGGQARLHGRIDADRFSAFGEDSIRGTGRLVRDSAGARLEGMFAGFPCRAAVRTPFRGSRVLSEPPAGSH